MTGVVGKVRLKLARRKAVEAFRVGCKGSDDRCVPFGFAYRPRLRAEAAASGAVWLAAAVAFAMACVACVPLAAFADELPSISYDGAAHELAASGGGGSDLFASFKDLMPGDERDQDVAVRVANATGAVRVYIQAQVDEATAKALEPASLSVSGGDGAAQVASGAIGGLPAQGSAGSVFGNKVLVAAFDGSGAATLKLHLSVPTSVGNELADAQRDVRWEVIVEDESGEYANGSGGATGGNGDSGGDEGLNSGNGSDQSAGFPFGMFSKTGDGPMEQIIGWLVLLACISVVVFIAAKAAYDRGGKKK